MLAKKITSISLITLGIIWLLNFLFFYFEGSVPDQSFSISSQTEHGSAFSYYFFSLVAFISFYSGPWVFLPFLIVAGRFLFLRNAYDFSVWKTEIAIITLSTLASYFIVLSTYPQLAGDGLAYYYQQTIVHNGLGFFLGLVCIFLFSLGLCHWSSKKLLEIVQSTFNMTFRKAEIILSHLKSILQKSKRVMSDPLGQIGYQYKIKLKGENQPLNESSDRSTQAFLEGQVVKKTVGDATMFADDDTFSDYDLTSTLSSPSESAHEFQEELPISGLESSSKRESPRQKNQHRQKGSHSKISTVNFDEMIHSLSANKNKSVIEGPDKEYFDTIISCLEEKIAEFKISGKIINVLKGPVVDTFELELGPGVKVSKVTGITEDLSLALSGAPIRIVYPMKGRTTVGIEVPRNPREIIYLDDVLNSKEFKNCSQKLPIALGKDAFGTVSVVDLAKMPHMLVAGATGAGKSVFINTLLVSLLVKLPPEKMKLILIDPKQLELALYAKLPHLLMPVITESKMASYALLWVCEEMERRYTILKEMAVRNIEGFNEKIQRASRAELASISQYYDDYEDFSLPYIVVIVDEFADLILTKVGKEIETNICRLAAKARAAGIHLVLATQRPSVDVITGLIKSNFPTRISFRVTSPMDSRTILNTMGAEKLLGMGDMLYKHGIDMGRYHSSYIDEREIENFVHRIYSGQAPEFHQAALDFLDQADSGQYGGSGHFGDGFSAGASGGGHGGESDELYPEAVAIVTQLRAASASMLQRKLKIGYNRAANLIEMMERDGVVGPQQGSKPRKVLSGGSDQQGVSLE